MRPGARRRGGHLVAWIDAESHDIASFQITICRRYRRTEGCSQRFTGRRFLDQLRSADAADCLFVFDSVENLSDLMSFTPEGCGVRVIVTATPPQLGRLGWLPLTVRHLRGEDGRLPFSANLRVTLTVMRQTGSQRGAATFLLQCPAAINQVAQIPPVRVP